MKKLTEDGITRSALSRISGCPDPRLKQIVRSLTRHLHAFAREIKLSPEEWMSGIQFLTDVGRITDEKRQEFILLSDVVGLSAIVDLIANRNGEKGATESSLLGPFFREGAPMLENDADISGGTGGERMEMRGRIVNADGAPIAHATVDTWQASGDGLYDLQREHSDEMSLRARFRTGDDGCFRFLSVKPSSYAVPADGPVGKMLHALARHPYRPAHIHFMIRAPGYKTLTTALYIKGDRYLDSDVVFGAKESLAAACKQGANGASAVAIEWIFVLSAAGRKKSK